MVTKYRILMSTMRGRVHVDVFADNYLQAVDIACSRFVGRPLEVYGDMGSATRCVDEDGSFKWVASSNSY